MQSNTAYKGAHPPEFGRQHAFHSYMAREYDSDQEERGSSRLGAEPWHCAPKRKKAFREEGLLHELKNCVD